MIAGALFKAFDFVAANRWAQYVLIGIAIIGTAGGYLLLRDNGVRRRVQEKNEREALKELARVEGTRRKIEVTRNEDVEQAREAGRNLPDFAGPAELRDKRPDIAAELFGDRATGDGKTEGR